MKKIFLTWDSDLDDSDGKEGLPDLFSFTDLYWNDDRTQLTIIAVDSGQWTNHAAFFSNWTEKP